MELHLFILLVYNYTGNPAVISETGLKLVKRNDISVAAWTDALATLDHDANTLTVTGATGTEYALAIPTVTTYQLTVTSTTGGTITAPASSPVTVNHGEATTITAVATAGYTFTGWTVVSGSGVTIATPSALSTTATLTSGDAAVRANFTLNTYQLTVTSTTGGTITAPASSPVTVNHGEATTITALATAGYTFTGWTVVSGSGVTIATPSALSTTATLTSGDAAVRANFTLTTAYGLQFNGTNQFVTFGAATTTLGAQTFTLECWFNWTGGGTTVSTGTGGLTAAYPLVTKGRGEGDGSNVDANYFLGIQGTGINARLAADFEDIDGATIDGDPAGQNQPIIGTITVTANVWHHVAATFDGTFWRLYLDGVLDNTLDVTNVGFTPPRPQFNSIQHAGLATAMTSAGVTGAAGFFAGVIDEARIWNFARTQVQIQTNINSELTSGTGLLGRWGLNDGLGTSAVNSIAGSPAGTLVNAPTWATPGAPFNITFIVPGAPTLLVATAISATQINLSWTDNASTEAAFEIERSTAGAGGPFTLLATVSANTTSYSDIGLTQSTTYWYQVRAVNGGGNSAYTNVANATTLSATPPTAPSSLTATASSAYQINLGWTDNSSNETNFEIERSTTGSGGPFTLLATVSAGTTSYSDAAVSPTNEYCYRVRATNGSGASSYAGPSCATTPAEGDYALNFGSSNAYVTFGQATSTLGVQSFTLECWFKRTGTGAFTTTGTSGVLAYPLITKGMAEADNSTSDMNYFLGINSTTVVATRSYGPPNVLVADFEEGTGATSPGLNHPVAGITPIVNDIWYHAAVTYDVTTRRWQLFLNGNLEKDTVLAAGTRFPQFNSIQHAALGTALQANGLPGSSTYGPGYFNGVMDEVHIWNYAKTQAEIRATINSQITTTQTGLLARWGLNEGTGTIVNGSAGTSVTGTIIGTGSSWPTPGAPFNISFTPPVAPSALTASAPSLESGKSCMDR